MSDAWKKVDLHVQPGHYARRLQQLAVVLFMQETGDLGLTPVQYATLHAICMAPGVDQKTLAASIGYDTSTIAGVIDRIEARGLVLRSVSPTDRRARLLNPTPAGLQMLEAVLPRMLKAQERLLAPLPKAERKEFLRLLKTVLDAYEDLSHTPARE